MRAHLPLLATLLAAMLASPAGAARRSPQIPVSGTALANFFASQGQKIDVNRDQLDLQTVSLLPDPRGAYNAIIFSNPNGDSFGLYDAGAADPRLYEVFPAEAKAHWFADVGVHDAPVRLIVNRWDSAGLKGIDSYRHFDGSNTGLYVRQDTGGVFYSEDSRNPGGAKILAFNGTGRCTGCTWLVFGTSSGPGEDYTDAILLVQPGGGVMDEIDWDKLREEMRRHPHPR